MKPLSRKKRKIYFYSFVIVFFALIPLVILYSMGYRLDNLRSLIKTGGVYVDADISGADVYLNGRLLKTTNLIQRSFFIQNLREGDFSLRIYKKDFWDWKKDIKVMSEKVVEVRPFLIPRMPEIIRIEKYAYGSDKKINKTYSDLSNLFSKADKEVKVLNKIEISYSENKAHIRWLGNTDSIPYFFCKEDKCSSDFYITYSSKIRNIDFLPGRDDVAIVVLSDGIFATDMSGDKDINENPIFLGSNLSIRVQNEQDIYAKRGDSIYSIRI